MEILKLLIKIINCGVGGGGVLSISLASFSLMMFLFFNSIHYILPKNGGGQTPALYIYTCYSVSNM